MRFSFTEDQLALAAGLRDLLDSECPLSAVRAVWDAGSGHDAELWSKLDGMGVLGLLVPESAGGFGAGEVEAVLVWQELGRAAVPGPVLEHMVAAPIVGGDAPLTVWFDGPYVAHAQVAGSILTRDSLITRWSAEEHEAIDGGRHLATVTPIETRPLAHDDALAFDRAALGAAAMLIGLSERMIELAGDYARQRQQFGKPIGAFQAVKHLMADALLQVEFAKPAAYRAAWSCASGDPNRTRDVSMAASLAAEASYRASRHCMQVHGGIGYTWEADLQLLMKKAWALSRAFGDASWHRRRVAAAVLGA